MVCKYDTWKTRTKLFYTSKVSKVLIGKSTFTEFMANSVIGNLGLVTGSEPLRSQFNIALIDNKPFVVFEELENFSTNEWQVIRSRLKRETTARNSQYEAKVKTRLLQKTQKDAVKDDDSRRYVLLGLSLRFKNNEEYWNKLYNGCVNDEVGEVFYNYFLEL